MTATSDNADKLVTAGDAVGNAIASEGALMAEAFLAGTADDQSRRQIPDGVET